MSARKTQLKKRRTQRELEDLIISAAECEFEKFGYVGATTAAIAKRANVTEAQIFRRFKSKQDLFRAAIFIPLNRHFSEFHALRISSLDRAETHREMAQAYIGELQGFMAQHSRMLMSLIVASSYNGDAIEPVSEMRGLREYFERGAAVMKARVGKSPQVDPKLMVRVSFAAVLACVMFKDWLFPRGLASADAIREAIADFVLDGINANETTAQ